MQWISVEDEMPTAGDDNSNFLVHWLLPYRRDGKPAVYHMYDACRFNEYERQFEKYNEGEYYTQEATHWLKITDPCEQLEHDRNTGTPPLK